MTIILKTFLVNCLSPFHLILKLSYFIFFLFSRCLFVYSFCLILCVCFYVLSISATSPGLGKVALCRRCPVGLSGMIPHWSPEPGAPQVSPVWAASTLLLWLGHDCCKYTGGQGWPMTRLPVWLGCNCCRCPDGRGWSPAKVIERYGHDFYECADMRGWPPGMGAATEEC